MMNKKQTFIKIKKKTIDRIKKKTRKIKKKIKRVLIGGENEDNIDQENIYQENIDRIHIIIESLIDIIKSLTNGDNVDFDFEGLQTIFIIKDKNIIDKIKLLKDEDKNIKDEDKNIKDEDKNINIKDVIDQIKILKVVIDKKIKDEKKNNEENFYYGEMNNGMKHGKGILKCKSIKNNEDIYFIGEWKDDKKDGTIIKFTHNLQDFNLSNWSSGDKINNIAHIIYNPHNSKYRIKGKGLTNISVLGDGEKKEDLTTIRELGKGVFGQVILCKDDTCNKYYASKYLNNHNQTEFENEKNILLKIQPKCKEYLLCIEPKYINEKDYIITEFLDGYIDLNKFIKDKCNNVSKLIILDIDEYAKICNNLLEGLKVIHEYGIFHRDIKPANIMIHPTEYKIKYIDFGLSEIYPNITREIWGTAHYICPPNYNKNTFNIKDYKKYDEFSLGVTFVNLCTGFDIEELYDKEKNYLYDNEKFNINEYSNLLKTLAKKNTLKTLAKTMGISFVTTNIDNLFNFENEVIKYANDKKLLYKPIRNLLHTELYS